MVFGIPLPNILDRWASHTGRCGGATAEKAVPFPSDRPSILIIRRLAAFNVAGFSVAVPAHARQLLEYLSIDGSRTVAGAFCPSRPAHGRTKGAHRSPALNSRTHVSRVPPLAGGEVNAPSARRKSPQIRRAL